MTLVFDLFCRLKDECGLNIHGYSLSRDVRGYRWVMKASGLTIASHVPVVDLLMAKRLVVIEIDGIILVDVG